MAELRRQLCVSTVEAWSPLLLVSSSEGSEALARKNGLSVADLLRPFATLNGTSVPFRSSTRSVNINELRARVLPVSELAFVPLETVEAHVARAVAAVPAGGNQFGYADTSIKTPEDAARALAQSTGQTGDAAPWLSTYRRELSRGLRCLPQVRASRTATCVPPTLPIACSMLQEMRDSPVALLVVVATSDVRPIAAFHELASSSALPRPFTVRPRAGTRRRLRVHCALMPPAPTSSLPPSPPSSVLLSPPFPPMPNQADHFDPDLQRHFILLHDAGAPPTGIDALALLREVGGGRRAAGGWTTAGSTLLLPPPPLLPQVRTYFPPSSCHLLPINSSGGGGVADGVPPPDIWAAHVSEPLFPPIAQGGALPPGGHAAALLSAAVVPGLRGCCLSAGDHRALCETLSRVLAAGVLPEAERRLAKLTAAALQARGGGRRRRAPCCSPQSPPLSLSSPLIHPPPLFLPPHRQGVASVTS